MTARISSSVGATMPDAGWWKARGFRWAVVERPDRVEILELPTAISEACSYPAGTAFGSGSELRWCRTRQGLHLVLIDDRGEVLPGAGGAAVEPAEAAGDGEVFLWGERGEDEVFWETRIPRPLTYPGVAARYAAAAVRSYRFSTAEFGPVADGYGQERGSREITRLMDLHGVER